MDNPLVIEGTGTETNPWADTDIDNLDPYAKFEKMFNDLMYQDPQMWDERVSESFYGGYEKQKIKLHFANLLDVKKREVIKGIRAYAEKIAEIEGGQSAAAYVFENATMAVDFPREALTSEADNYFYGTGSDQLAAMKAYLDAGNEAAYWGEYAASWQVLQNSETWSGAPLANTNVAFVFKNAVYPQAFHSRIGSTEWSLHATNDWEVFTAYLQNGASPEFMTTLIDSGESTNTTGGKDVPVDGSRAFKYYVFKYTYVWSNIYNMSLKTLAGNVSCALSSANMTPEVKVYLTDYMRLITQPFYCEGKVIPYRVVFIIKGKIVLVSKPKTHRGFIVIYSCPVLIKLRKFIARKMNHFKWLTIFVNNLAVTKPFIKGAQSFFRTGNSPPRAVARGFVFTINLNTVFRITVDKINQIIYTYIITVEEGRGFIPGDITLSGIFSAYFHIIGR